MPDVSVVRAVHGHHKVAAAIFVGSLLLAVALFVAAEVLKPDRYEFHSGTTENTYIIYDRETGQATTAEFNSKNPKAALAN